MALVILVRHGQTDENVSGRISGQGPVPLNARGQEQARLAAEVLAPLGITHIFSSPLVRARQTAEFLAERLQKSIKEIPDLREVGYGDWEGKTFNEMRTHPVAHQVFNDPINATFPNGESLLEVQQRGIRVIEWVRNTYPQGLVTVVSHGDVIRTALAHYLGMPFNEYRRLTWIMAPSPSWNYLMAGYGSRRSTSCRKSATAGSSRFILPGKRCKKWPSSPCVS